MELSTNNAHLSDDELSSLKIGSNTKTNEGKLTDVCAACGKEGGDGDNMNTCNKCKMVTYCNAACKKKHRSKHKKKCDRRVAELHDEALFKEPPTREECPICFLPIPVDMTQSTIPACCGKLICIGCLVGMISEQMKKGKKEEELGICAFCRTPKASSDEENIERNKKLMEKGNAEAYNQLATAYAGGKFGLPQDWTKANELWRKAGELGCTNALSHLGKSYDKGMGVVVDQKKAKHYYELAAMGGDIYARHNLGCKELNAGNYQRAYNDCGKIWFRCFFRQG